MNKKANTIATMIAVVFLAAVGFALIALGFMAFNQQLDDMDRTKSVDVNLGAWGFLLWISGLSAFVFAVYLSDKLRRRAAMRRDSRSYTVAGRHIDPWRR